MSRVRRPFPGSRGYARPGGEPRERQSSTARRFRKLAASTDRPAGRCLHYGVPAPGGTRTFLLRLQHALGPIGWEVRAFDFAFHDPAARLDDEVRARLPCDLYGMAAGTAPSAQLAEFAGAVTTDVPTVVISDRGFIFKYLPKAVWRIGICHALSRRSLLWLADGAAWSDGFVAISPRLRRMLAGRFGEERVALIPHGVAPGPSAERPPLGGRPLRIVTVGRLEERHKACLGIPPVADRLARRGVLFEWTVVGDGPERGRMARRIADLGLSDRVRMAGWIENDRVREVLREQDVFVMLSRSEGLGLAVVEAMAEGVAPVASRLPEVTDYILADGRAGVLCEPDDWDGFAAALAGLAADEDRLRELRRRALARASEEFSVETMGRRYAAVFERVMSAGRARPDALPAAGFVPEGGCLPDRLRALVPGSLRRALHRLARR